MMKCKELTPKISLHEESLSPDASSCISGASKTGIRPFIKEMGSSTPVLQRKNGHQFALKRNRKLRTKHSAMETCVCGSQDPFLSVRIHMKSPLAAFRVSINSSKMIGIKGSKHSLLTKAPLCLPAAAPRPLPPLSPALTGPIVPLSHSSCTGNKDIKARGRGLLELWEETQAKEKSEAEGKRSTVGDLRVLSNT